MGRRELDLVILMGPLEFKIFYNSTILAKCQQAAAREHRGEDKKGGTLVSIPMKMQQR